MIFQVCLVAEVVFGKLTESRTDLPFVCIILALIQILSFDPVLHHIAVTLELPGI